MTGELWPLNAEPGDVTRRGEVGPIDSVVPVSFFRLGVVGRDRNDGVPASPLMVLSDLLGDSPDLDGVSLTLLVMTVAPNLKGVPLVGVSLSLSGDAKSGDFICEGRRIEFSLSGDAREEIGEKEGAIGDRV